MRASEPEKPRQGRYPCSIETNPYFAVTDADGHFKIANLPPGNYTLTAYHPRAHRLTKGISQEIKVTGAGSVVADFTVEVTE